MAESIKTLIRDFKKTISANTNMVVDSLPLVAFEALEYSVTYSVAVPFKTKILKLLVRKTDTDLATQVFGKAGDAININIDAFRNGSNMELRVNNFESFSVELKATRLII